GSHIWHPKRSKKMLDCHHFPHCIIRNLIQSDSFTENLQRELLDLNFHEKSNDLYKFNQSDDLKKRKEPHITGLFGRFRSWLGEVLGVELKPTVDISCSKYQYTDVLLCHDDELEGRRVAFILYFVPPWESSDGGTLDLFSADVKKCCGEVSGVAVVQSTDGCLSVCLSRFHGPSLERPPRHTEPPFPRSPHLLKDVSVLLLEWLNPLHLDVDYQSQCLSLQEEKFKEVSEALRSTDVQWTKQGPPNRMTSLESFPQCVSACWALLLSEAFLLLLSNFTGLRLHYLSPSDEDKEEEKDQEDEQEREATGSSGYKPSANKNTKGPSTPVCVGELRRWAHGDYTLLHDGDASRAEYALDLLLPLSCPGWQTEFGGFTSYIANEEDEELLMVYPEVNSLALVYRDKETLKFVKHIIHRSSTLPIGDSCRRAVYDFSFVCYE
uniref:2-oxoglutarate and iron-dependent oxygenase domain containing 1 n=1 Tax=Oncorhynchus kisutch TaxID=8019 RepID=A0A8C7GS12_ONCKI